MAQYTARLQSENGGGGGGDSTAAVGSPNRPHRAKQQQQQQQQQQQPQPPKEVSATTTTTKAATTKASRSESPKSTTATLPPREIAEGTRVYCEYPLDKVGSGGRTSSGGRERHTPCPHSWWHSVLLPSIGVSLTHFVFSCSASIITGDGLPRSTGKSGLVSFPTMYVMLNYQSAGSLGSLTIMDGWDADNSLYLFCCLYR